MYGRICKLVNSVGGTIVLKRFINDTKKYWESAKFSAKSSLKSEVASSHLSWLWWILDPLLFMLVYSFIALIVFGRGEKYFAAFVFIGLSSWNFFSKTVRQSVRLVSQNSAIVSKVYLPKYVLVYTQIMINGFKMLISFVLVIGIMIIYRVPVDYNLLFVIPLFLTLGLLTFGISSIMLHFGVWVDDLFNVVNVLLKLVFYLSGIFYNIANRNIPEPYAGILLKGNPIAFVMNELRNCMIYSTTPDLVWLAVWFVAGIILSVIGVKIIYKYENSYVKVI
ncbi:MAG: ABC transporter permease [Lachnospiraceae bacterium]|jgi:ABC-type polysaccharide/polyol phosphate export systems, permease component|nr:ABC transporter permease [Lachnospiraceae bacterium]